VLADQQQGLIDEHAASVISRRTASLLDAGSARDPNQAAKRVSDFGRRLDTLAARGEISSPASAALKAAAAELTNAMMSSSGSNADASPASHVPATDGEAAAPEAHDKGGHPHDGSPAGSQD
jgi:hypothetical protein